MLSVPPAAAAAAAAAAAGGFLEYAKTGGARRLQCLLQSPSVLAPACVRIHKGSKKTHFAEIREASGVPFDEMVFFDDDPANIRDVAPLGVVCQLTPDGVTAAAWEAALGAYAKARP